MRWLGLGLVMSVLLILGAQARPPAPPAAEMGNAERAGWVVDPASGCWLWNARPGSNAEARWSGACPAGPAEGQGVASLRYTWNGRTIAWRYTGGMRASRFEGEGRYDPDDPDDVAEEGSFRAGLLHGQGSQIGSGLGYRGEWFEGRPHGRGMLIGPSGSRFEGEWVNGVAEGPGRSRLGPRGDWVPAMARQGCVTREDGRTHHLDPDCPRR